MTYIRKQDIEALNIDILLKKLNPVSNLGKRLFANLTHFTTGQEREVEEEYNKISEIKKIADRRFFEDLVLSLKHCENIKLILEKISKQKILELFEIQEVKAFIFFYEKIRNLLIKSSLDNVISLFDFSELLSYLDIENQNIPSFSLSSKYSEELNDARRKISDLAKKKNFIKMKNFQQAREKLNIPIIEEKVVVSKYNKGLIDKLEASKWFYKMDENFANLTYHFDFEKKYFLLEEEISKLILDAKQVEVKIRKDITKKMFRYIKQLINSQNEIAKLDWLIARTRFAVEFDCIIPEISSKMKIKISKSRNIPLEISLKNEKIEYQKINLDFDESLNIITGANMAGKTTILKTSAQFIFLTSLGIPLPCESAEISLFSFLFFSGSSFNSNRMDLSSFGTEVVEINKSSRKKGNGLFLIDEFARGTNPQEGVAFSKAIFDYLYKKKKFVIATTHFDLGKISNAKNYQVIGIKKEDCLDKDFSKNLSLKEKLSKLHKIMNYQINCIENSTKPPKAALFIAEALGVDKEIMLEAEKYFRI